MAESKRESIDRVVGGIYYSGTNDFTSAVIEVFKSDGSVNVIHRSWITKRCLTCEDLTFGKESEFTKSGELEVVDSDFVHYLPVVDWFVEQSQKYDIESIGIDPFGGRVVAECLESRDFETVNIRQGALTLNNPFRNLMALENDRKLEKGAMLDWYFGNVEICTDHNGNQIPTSQSRAYSIAGFRALLNAHAASTMSNSSNGNLFVKVNVDVSEAITGLKALQREAKAATKALAELREEQAKGHLAGRLYIGEEYIAPPVYVDGKKIEEASTKIFRKEER